jgi:hypothetical protein
MIGGGRKVVNLLKSAANLPYTAYPVQCGVSWRRIMSSLSTLFKKEGLVERHQIEGMDPSARYFNRSILVNKTPTGYAAKVMYEALTVEGQSHPTISAAVEDLVKKLHPLGFTKLRTRANFKGSKYLAEKETWIDYADPA